MLLHAAWHDLMMESGASICRDMPTQLAQKHVDKAVLSCTSHTLPLSHKCMITMQAYSEQTEIIPNP